jgi:hypothetical protein
VSIHYGVTVGNRLVATKAVTEGKTFELPKAIKRSLQETAEAHKCVSWE